jgi:hypothetical protein
VPVGLDLKARAAIDSEAFWRVHALSKHMP